MLACEALRVAYGASTVLHDVTLAVPPHGLVGILGPNGSGKTTLLRAFSRAVAPTSGRVTLGGEPLDPMTQPEYAAYVGAEIKRNAEIAKAAGLKPQ